MGLGAGGWGLKAGRGLGLGAGTGAGWGGAGLGLGLARAGAGGWADCAGGLGGWVGLGEFCIGNCDRNMVLCWSGLEIDGLGGSTPATTSSFYLFLS